MRKIYYSQNTVNLNDRLSNLQTHYKINKSHVNLIEKISNLQNQIISSIILFPVEKL